MKLVNRAIVFILFFSVCQSGIHCKEIECFFDHREQTQWTAECSTSHVLISELRLENVGGQPVKDVFPLTRSSQCLTLDSLASWLLETRYPILSLYRLWNDSVVPSDHVPASSLHPIELLNNKGICSTSEYEQQFLKLCQSLGFDIRLANVKGKTVYDFSLEEGEWTFLDLSTGQIYLSMNNETPISSEEVMDDPFIALRTKHGSAKEQLNLDRTWSELARFAIIEPAMAEKIEISLPPIPSHQQGYELFPLETLAFRAIETGKNPNGYERSATHRVNLNERNLSGEWTYHSPIPLTVVVNQSTAQLNLKDFDVVLEPEEAFHFEIDSIYSLKISFDNVPEGTLLFEGALSQALFPSLPEKQQTLSLNTKLNHSKIKWTFCIDEDENSRLSSPLDVKVEEAYPPVFSLSPVKEVQIDEIWWQISSAPDFTMIPSNFNQVEPYRAAVTFPLISETLLNPETTYYFRVRAFVDGTWNEWSAPQPFVIHKPIDVQEVEFNKIDDNSFELTWERRAEETDDEIEYLVFGSNSLDFIPSIYCSKQINGMVDGEVVDADANENLIAIVPEPKVQIGGGLAYYRIVARVKSGKYQGRLSVPSEIIHVYDEDLIQPRNVLQVSIDEEDNEPVVKRMLVPAQYADMQVALPHTNSHQDHFSRSPIKIQALLRAATRLDVHEFAFNKNVDPKVWEDCKPYFLPSNHPVIPKLNRMFSAQRITISPESCKKAGFSRWKPGRWSRVLASSHPDIKEHFLKIYCDNEVGIKYDYLRWIHRIQGANLIRDCIKRHNYGQLFSVPRKWLYPLPEHPSCPKGTQYIPKHFVLVCDNMRILGHSKNEKKYKSAVDKKRLQAMYVIFQECGLYDSTYCFNCPFCKDGRIALIDTEYWHRWPVPFHKMTHYFSKDMQREWERIYQAKLIPDGKSKPWIPRQDRRDP
jgi:hypothetical protein